MSDVTKRNQVASLSLLWLILWLLFFADDDSCVLSAATSHTKDHKSNQRILRDIAGFVTLVWGFVLFGFVCVWLILWLILWLLFFADDDSCSNKPHKSN